MDNETARIIRKTDEDLRHEIDDRQPIQDGATLRFAGTVVDLGDIPKVGDAIYMVRTIDVDVDDDEGSSPSYIIDDAGQEIPVLVLNSLANAGDELIAFSISGHWVAQHKGTDCLVSACVKCAGVPVIGALVTITKDAETIGTCVTSGFLTTISMTSNGSGYTSPPTVVISGGGGSGATGNAVINGGAVTGVTITKPGTGFTSNPTISFTGVVTSITVTSGGADYTPVNVVDISGGGGSGATATARISGHVTLIEIANTGAGYTNATVAITSGGGSGATATAIVAAGLITGFTITNAGTGYTSNPTVTITGDGHSAAATASVVGPISGITVTNPGTGYTSAPTVDITGDGAGATATAVISGGGGTGAAATATIGGGGCCQIAIPGPDTYTIDVTADGFDPFTVTQTLKCKQKVDVNNCCKVSVCGIRCLSLFAVSGATISIKNGGSTIGTCTTGPSGIVSVTLVNGGHGYTSAPTFTVTQNSGGSGATGTTTIEGGVVKSITLTSPGDGYTNGSAPNDIKVVFSGGLPGSGATANALAPTNAGCCTIDLGSDVIGTGATATATISGGHVTGFTITSGGSNYGAPPQVVVSGTGGAAGTATVSGGAVTGITLTNGGSGYVIPPAVSFLGGILTVTGTKDGLTGSSGLVTLQCGSKTSVSFDFGHLVRIGATGCCGHGLPGASVEFGGMHFTTGADGRVPDFFVPAGTYDWSISKDRFVAKSGTCIVTYCTGTSCVIGGLMTPAAGHHCGAGALADPIPDTLQLTDSFWGGTSLTYMEVGGIGFWQGTLSQTTTTFQGRSDYIGDNTDRGGCPDSTNFTIWYTWGLCGNNVQVGINSGICGACGPNFPANFSVPQWRIPGGGCCFWNSMLSDPAPDSPYTDTPGGQFVYWSNPSCFETVPFPTLALGRMAPSGNPGGFNTSPSCTNTIDPDVPFHFEATCPGGFLPGYPFYFVSGGGAAVPLLRAAFTITITE